MDFNYHNGTVFPTSRTITFSTTTYFTTLSTIQLSLNSKTTNSTTFYTTVKNPTRTNSTTYPTAVTYFTANTSSSSTTSTTIKQSNCIFSITFYTAIINSTGTHSTISPTTINYNVTNNPYLLFLQLHLPLIPLSLTPPLSRKLSHSTINNSNNLFPYEYSYHLFHCHKVHFSYNKPLPIISLSSVTTTFTSYH